jgi:tetratricopeptide (TPR) repeat protein
MINKEAKKTIKQQSKLILPWLITLAFIGTPASFAAYDTREVLIQLNNEAIKSLNAGRFKEAIEKLEKALQLDPSYTLARDNLAVAYNNYGLQLQNNPKEAIKIFHKSLVLSPNNATAQSNLDAIIDLLGKNPKSFADRVELGKQARLANDFDGAIVEYTYALKLKDDPTLHVSLGDVYRVRDKVDSAIAEYTAALKGGLPADQTSRVYVSLGQAYQAKRDLVSAIAAYENAWKAKPDDRDVLDALKAGWEEALRLNPTAASNHIGLGRAYQYAGDFGQAEAEFKQALVFDHNNQIAKDFLGALSDAKKKYSVEKHINAGYDLQKGSLYDAAISEYKAAIDLDPKNATAWANMGTAYQQNKDFDKAIEAYNRALFIEPSNAIAKDGIQKATADRETKKVADSTAAGVELFKQGKYEEALAKYQQVLKVHADDPALHFSIAATLQAMKRIDEAIAEYKQAIRLDPKNTEYQNYLDAAVNLKADPIIAEALKKHEQKDYAAAISLYTQAIDLRPKNASLLYNLASAYYAREQYLEAKRAYEKALEVDPKGQVDNWWFLAAIEEHYKRGQEAIADYRKYIVAQPNGKYAPGAKERLAALAKNINDTIRIKSEAELNQLKEASDAYETANKLQQEKKYDEAIVLYQKANKIQPKESAYAYGLGYAFQQKGEIDQAIRWYQEAINLEPSNKDYPKVLQTAYEAKAVPIVEQAVKKQTEGDLTAAIALYKQALEIVKDNARLWTNLGSAYQLSDDFMQARAAYQKALELDARNESTNWYVLAAIDEHYKQGAKALAEYQKYIATSPGHQFVSQASARIKALTANINDTQVLPTQSQIKTATSSRNAFDEGVKFQQANKFDEAIIEYKKAMELMPSESSYAFALASAYQGKSDFDNAILYYKKALDMDPKNPDYIKYYNAATDLKAAPILEAAIKKHTEEDYQSAIALYNQALAIVPKNARAHTNAAAAYQAAGDFAAAKSEYQKAYDLDSKGEAEVLYFLAALDEHFNQGAQALTKYRNYITSSKGQFVQYAQERVNALARDVHNTQKLQTQAEMKNVQQVQAKFDQAIKLQQDGKYDDAIKLYIEILATSPNEAAYHYALGTAYQGKGDMDLAIESYKKASSLDSLNKEYTKVLSAAYELKAAPMIEEAIKKHTAGDLNGAVELYKAALVHVPKNARLHTNLATALQALDKFAEARDEYQKAVGLDAKAEVDDWYFIGAIDEHFNKGSQAWQDYSRYVQLAPKGSYFSLAQARMKDLQINPNNTQKLKTQADVQRSTESNQAYESAVKLQQEGKLDEAIAEYKKALAINNDASIWYSLGTAYQAKNDIDQALESYLKASALNPKENAYKQLIKQMRQTKAAPLLEAAYQKQTTKDGSGNYDLNGAITSYEEALKIDDDAGTRLNLGTAYQGNKNVAKAVEQYKRALVIDNKQYDAYYYLGTAYEAMGQPKLAIAEYNKYLQYQPTGANAPEVRSRLKVIAR